MSAVATIERRDDVAVVHLEGDIVAAVAAQLYEKLRAACRRRDVAKIVVDFSHAGRLDSSAVAVLSLVGRQVERAGKTLELVELAPHHRAALALAPSEVPEPRPIEQPGVIEQLGESTIELTTKSRSFVALVIETVRQAFAVLAGKRRLPAGSVALQISTMGVDAIFIVALLSFLIGMTIAFQGAVQFQRFGAAVYVPDMVGVAMVRELGPLMTAVILTGRTGAAIAAELGTMRVRSEIDALSTMGISPVRFLVVPRVAAITFAVPALALMAMFVGILGGMVVAVIRLDMPVATFWRRITEFLEFDDYTHGISKSFVFAWIIGFAGSHLGLSAGQDPASVGAATTRTVVASVFFIIITDAVWATVSTALRY